MPIVSAPTRVASLRVVGELGGQLLP